MKVYAMTDTGKVRKENQDAFSFELNEKKNRVVAVVCDGMGGARAGSLASSLAVESFMSRLLPVLNSPKRISNPKNTLEEAVEFTNTTVYRRSISDDSARGMGTTLVALLRDGGKSYIANVGDSRAYHISGGPPVRITRDHSLVEELVMSGQITAEEAQTHPRKNLITRAVGVDVAVECDIFVLSPKKGDFILLCSDGLSNMVRADEMPKIFGMEQEPEFICKALLELALERGATDNVSAAVVKF